MGHFVFCDDSCNCNNTHDDDDDNGGGEFPQVTQDNIDAGLIENMATVNATSTEGSTTAIFHEEVEIERDSSLIVGELHHKPNAPPITNTAFQNIR